MTTRLFVLAGLLIALAGCGSTPSGDAKRTAPASPTVVGTGAENWWSAGPPAPAPKAGAAPQPAAAPSLDPVFGANADESWSVNPVPFEVATDPDLGRPVLTVGGAPRQLLTLTGRTSYPAGIQVTALVRMIKPGAAAIKDTYAEFYTACHEGPNPSDAKKTIKHETYFYLYADRASDTINAAVYEDGKTLNDLKALEAKSDWAPQNANSFRYELHAFQRYLPGWPEDFREHVEADMAPLPGVDHKWVRVRMELAKGLVRFWMDDHLVAWKKGPAVDPQGTMRLAFYSGVQIADFRIAPLQTTPGFEPVRLTGYLNGRTFIDHQPLAPTSGGAPGSGLPPADQLVSIGDIPFVFPGVAPGDTEGNDHLDITRSYLREANTEGYIPTQYGDLARWRGSEQRDPVRIQLRVPFAWYNRLYVIAASEDKPDTVPVLSAMFFRPGAGYPQTVHGDIPLATSQGTTVGKPLPVRLANGKPVNLWLVEIPIDPAMLTSFSDMDVVEIELTKNVYLYRSYPDPISYSYHQGGLPSAVHVYALTLGESPVDFDLQADKFGHVWTSPAVPTYSATVVNHTGATQTGTITYQARSYDGTQTLDGQATVGVGPMQAATRKFTLPVKLNGYHDLTVTLKIAGQTWTEKRSFVRLAPDTRTPHWTEGRGAMFGYWSYMGGHHTPHPAHIRALMDEAGARGLRSPPPGSDATGGTYTDRAEGTAYYVTLQPWAADEHPDPAKIEEFRKTILKNVASWEKGQTEAQRPDHVYYFAENWISARLTPGNYPEYWGDPPFQYTDEEKQTIKEYMGTCRIAGEIIRKELPGRKILIEWGDPLFPVPLLRAGFPKDLIDGSGIDLPNFERLPEMQLADNAVNRLYELRQEYAKRGIDHPLLQQCEGTFVPTEPGACDWREQMDIYNRWSLISMAYGIERFYAGWFAFDCGNYYGTEHYGGCGIQRRIPYCDPKLAYAAFATMTDKLNEATFDGFVKTGSLTTYCLRFKKADDKGYIYALWTIRGKRPVTLTLAQEGKVGVTDAMNNTKETPAQGKTITVSTDPSVVYVTGTEVTAAAVGEPDNSDSKPAPTARQIANLGDGTWHYTSQRDPIYENNHWGYYPALGKFTAETAPHPGPSDDLVSRLEKQDHVRELMPWYNVLRPAKPIRLDGAPSHLGLWVQGHSDWGRVVYILRDAQGERWISIGTKDQYNCNDIHAWSSFNFDGWRYLRFELPGHLGYDNFRRFGTTWWRNEGGPDAPSGGSGVVDLPLTLEGIIVEQRTHEIYVNGVQPAASDTVRLGKLFVEYETPADATPEALRESRLRMPLPTGLPELPNPIADMTRDGVGAPVTITGLKQPVQDYDGTRMHVFFTQAPPPPEGPEGGAKKYLLWVSAHEDGRGAVNLVPAGVKSGDLVHGLRPAIKLYYWITYEDAKGKMSKPSPVHEEITVDNFKEK